MSGILVIRTLLVVALFVTAHVIRPFSIKNVTQHLIYSTRSFAFVLPGQTRAEFDTANDLALSLSDGLFNPLARQFVEAPAGAGPDSWQLALKLVTLDGANRVMQGPKSAGKRSAPARRLPRIDRVDSADLIAGFDLSSEETVDPGATASSSLIEEPAEPAQEAALAALPALATGEFAEVKAVPAAFLLPALNTIRKTDCRKPETSIVSLVAVTDGKAIRLSLRLAQLVTVAPECEGPTVAAPVPVEIEAPEIGPELQMTGEFLGEQLQEARPVEQPESVEMEATETTEPEPAGKPTMQPLKCVIW
ncbi:MAG: hypothetical protein SF339_08765 [Blastocatellia bacterium]|nr:hypothetical protein [Blastocatellia bacterium]